MVFVRKEKKEVPVKNYIFLSIIVLVTILLAFYFYLWYLTYEESKLNNQIMDRYMQVINYNELSNYIDENKNAYIYVSVLENQDVRDFEKKFKTTIIDNSLKNEILYLDLTEIYNNKTLINKAKKDYKIEDKTIADIPCILVFKDGKLTEIYDIKQNNYDINLIENFLQQEGLELND